MTIVYLPSSPVEREENNTCDSVPKWWGRCLCKGVGLSKNACMVWEEHKFEDGRGLHVKLTGLSR